MGKLSSKLRENENKTNVPIYQIYLPKLHENIFNWYRLNSFNKSPLASTTVSTLLAMDCRIVVSEFVLQSRYYVHFRANTLGKGMNPLILPAMG